MLTKLHVLAIALSLGGIFAAGVAVGKDARQPRFVARGEVKWIESPGGPKMAVLSGDLNKGPYVALLQLPAGSESPWHSHTGDYEAIQISGTTRHWMRGEDGTRAKKLPPGSYWMMPGGPEHVTACDPGADCLVAIWQKTRFDALPGRDAMKSATPGIPAKSATK